MQVPAHVEYEKAASVEHALELLARYGPEARVLAGGHSLIPMMKLRLAQPETLVDINALAELDFLAVTGGGTGGETGSETGGELRIGALTRHAGLLDSAVAGELFPVLHDAERVIADPIVRNWGTVGGSLCQADPSEDLSAAFAALKATMVIRGPAGTRTVPARDFHTAPYETAVAAGEILTEIRIALRALPSGGAYEQRRVAGYRSGSAYEQRRADGYRSGSAYEKVGRRVGDWPVGAAAAALWLDGDTIAEAGIGLSAVGARNFAAAEAEEFLVGRPATPEAFARAGEIAAEHCSPSADQRGPVDYKRHLARELTSRALARALLRAAGEPAGPSAGVAPARPDAAGG